MARLIIHAGMGKTGTSAIQVSLLKNQEALAAQGIVFLRTNQPKPEQSAKHRLKWRDYRAEPWKELREEAGRLAGTDKTVVLSNDTLWKKNAKELRFLKKIFKGYEFTIVFYVREQVEFLESRALQAMKRDRNAKNRDRKKLKLDFSDPANPAGLESFLEKFAPHLDYLEVAKRWESVFGKGTVQSRLYMRDVFSGGNVVADFYEAIGASTDSLNLSTEMNPSLSVPFAAITTEREKYFAPEISNPEVLDSALRLSKVRKSNLPKLISPERADKIRTEVADSNKAFFSRFVVNADEFKVKEWKRGKGCDFNELAAEMKTIISNWPLIAFKNSGPDIPSTGVFYEGWKMEGVSPQYRATQASTQSTLRFRIHVRSRLRSGDSDLSLYLTCIEQDVIRSVRVCGSDSGKIDVSRSPILIPVSALGEYDNVEIEILIPEGETSSLTVTELKVEESAASE